MNNWRCVKVEVLVREGVIEPPMDGNHGDIHPKGNDFVNSGIPFIMASDLEKGIVDFKNCLFISKKQADKLRKGFSKEGDVLLTHKATIGRTAIVPRISTPYIMLTPQVTYYRIVKTEILNNVFLKYYFDSQTFQSTLSNWAGVGSTRSYIGILNQHNLPISYPKIEIQNGIAKILSLLDSKIELNNRINAELEAMAKTLYDYWFVQFDFPDDNGKPYKSSGGKMVYSKELKREIPEGWEDGCLSGIAHITMGQSPSGESYNEDGNGVIFFQGCTDFGQRYPKIRQYTTEPSRIAEAGDILLSVRAPVGTLNIANQKCCIGRGLSALKSKVNSQVYLYQILKDLKVVFDRRNSDGTTFGSITKDDLFSLKVVIPSNIILEKFNTIVKPIFEKQNTLEFENQELSSLRDWLLPMLMNGQVKVVGEKEKKEYKMNDEVSMAAEP